MYFSQANACNEPNSETPLSAVAIANQNTRVANVGNEFLDGNAAVYDLVLALGGNLPGLVPASPDTAASPSSLPSSATSAFQSFLASIGLPSPAASPTPSSASAVPTTGAGGSTVVPAPASSQAPSGAFVPGYAAPGVLAAPPLNAPRFRGGARVSPGVNLGPAVSSMVQGCNLPWAGPSLGANSQSAAAAPDNSGLMLWGLAGLVAALWWLGSEAS
jgi:hypothetical protein